MKRNFKAEFAGYKKLDKKIGIGLYLSKIRDENNISIVRTGTVRITEGFKNVGRLEKGDVLEFETEVKKAAFEYPKNVKMFERKFSYNETEPLENFFDIKKK